MHKPLLFIIISLSISFSLYAQTPLTTGSVHGFVYEKESGEPAVFTTVYLKGTKFGTSSDVNGFYTISRIPPGTYLLSVTTVGYDTLQSEIVINADQVLSKQVYLKKSIINLNN